MYPGQMSALLDLFKRELSAIDRQFAGGLGRAQIADVGVPLGGARFHSRLASATLHRFGPSESRRHVASCGSINIAYCCRYDLFRVSTANLKESLLVKLVKTYCTLHTVHSKVGSRYYTRDFVTRIDPGRKPNSSLTLLSSRRLIRLFCSTLEVQFCCLRPRTSPITQNLAITGQVNYHSTTSSSKQYLA